VKAAVVGGGLAGLAAACRLAEMGHAVTLFERRPWCGGKTYSHRDPETGESIDNGQHVFMTCTTAYLEFLSLIGSRHLVKRQRRLRVRVYDAHGRLSEIRADGLPPPAHLAVSFLRYGHLRLSQKAGIARALLAATRMREAERLSLHGQSLGEWLRSRRQDDAVIRDFWDFMLIPTLNCRAGEASASLALFVLRHGFLHSNTAAAIGVSAVGLSELHVDPAVAFLAARGGCVRTGTAVEEIVALGGRAVGLKPANGPFEPFDGVVCALPPRESLRVLPTEVGPSLLADLAAVRMAPIVNLHCWFDRPVAAFPFAAFVGNELQWVFNRTLLDRRPAPPHHRLVVSLSAAEPYMTMTKRELQERFLPQLRAALPAARPAELVRFAAFKEPEATFVPAPGMVRPPAETAVAGLVLAGAHTDTGWPATMESAVRSGFSAAEALAVHLRTQEPRLQAGRR
jgi:squalene-associated FAD-dependent desaturase